MLSIGRRSLRLKEPPGQQQWICGRCFHAQNRIYATQPSEPPNNPSKSSPEKPISPIDTFRRGIEGLDSSAEPPKQSNSPAEIFRTHWMNLPSTESPAPPNFENFSLGDLAEAYRKTGTPRKYVKRDIWFTEPKQEENQTTLEDIEELSQLKELRQLDELETHDLEFFEGENMREYQGVLPLNGAPYVQEKHPLKQGALIETRGYLILLLILTQ